MAKKNPYVFTIGFDETDPSHVRAAEILNGTKKKAQLIAGAILNYVDGVNAERAIDFSLEMFQPFVEQLIQKELEKVMKSREFSQSTEDKDAEKVLDLSTREDELPMDESMTQNIMNAMDVFRRTS